VKSSRSLWKKCWRKHFLNHNIGPAPGRFWTLLEKNCGGGLALSWSISVPSSTCTFIYICMPTCVMTVNTNFIWGQNLGSLRFKHSKQSGDALHANSLQNSS
jgi:hypothetical protein